MTWVLHYAPKSCALATHLALEHAAAEYDTVRVDLQVGEQQSPQYLAINSRGRVPSLVTADGVLTETPALLAYIAQCYPRSGLAPVYDYFAMARANAFNSYLCSTVHVAHAHRMRGHRWADEPAALEAMRRKVPQAVGDAFAYIEYEALRGPWVLEEGPSMCDYYLLTIARWLEIDGVDLARLPRVLAHRAMMLELPLVREVIETEES